MKSKPVIRHVRVERVQALERLAPHLEAYLEELKGREFSSGVRYEALRLHTHFHRFLVRHNVKDVAEVTAGHVTDFFRKWSVRFRKMHGCAVSGIYAQVSVMRIREFLNFARERMGLDPLWTKLQRSSQALPPELINAYLEFGRIHRGYRPATVKRYCDDLVHFGLFLDERGVASVKDISVADLDAYFVAYGAVWNPRTLQGVASALIMFFRYLFLTDQIAVDLAARVMKPRRFRGELRPKYIPWERVQAFLKSIDRSTSAGKRDYAIAVLLASYGLRGREVAALRTDDIDWEQMRLVLRERKDGRMAVFPLQAEAATALREYLDHARPSTPHAGLFITSKAPFKPLPNTAIVSTMRRHLEKFSLDLPFHGLYLLRHSFAKALLDRGAGMAMIQNLLGHQRLKTTLIYTRIATEELREVAANYARFL